MLSTMASSTSTSTVSSTSPSLYTFVRHLWGSSPRPLDLVPEVLLGEVAAEYRRPASSRRHRNTDARRRHRAVSVVQADRLQPRLEGEVVLY
jgi:hypothetical protein